MVYSEEEERRLDELLNLVNCLITQDQWPSSRIEEWCQQCETKQQPEKQQPQEQEQKPDEEWKASFEDDEPPSHKQEKELLISQQLLLMIEYVCISMIHGDDEHYDDENLHKIIMNVRVEEESLPSPEQQHKLRILLRISKHFLRGILRDMFSSSTRSKDSSSQIIMTSWRSIRQLRQYLSWIQEYCGSDPVLAQHASQILFYASYNPISGSDQILIDSYEQLLEQDQVMSQLLSYLLHSLEDIPLALSLVRNVHNVIVSFPQGKECALAARIEDSSLPDSPLPDCFENSSHVTFSSLLPYLALRALDKDPPYSGHDPDDDDKRAELVMEILRAAYVLRLGKQIETDPQGLFGQLIVKLLRLDVSNTPRCEECRREAIPPLMDASAEAVGTFLLTHNVLSSLWSILEQQVSQAVTQTLIQDSAAAALTPILVVLHKVATHHTDIRCQLKSYVFPDDNQDDEDSFHEKKRREIEQHGKCRNMKPLDAPHGTLRYKLIQLMTWPQSHIKRFTGELLWSLCEGDAQEFIARVGMGNAVVILGARGLVRLPSQIVSS